MDVLFWVVVSFGAGIWVGAQQTSRKRGPVRKASNDKVKQARIPAVAQTPAPPSGRYRHSRWEDKNDLFWGMMDMGIIVENRQYLTTPTERDYLKKLEEWFGHYCAISCQVSPGRFLKFPEQDNFSDEERARFFTQFNAMSVDYVLVSRKNNKIICSIELDDKSHEQEDRIARDKRLEQLFDMAGVPLLRVSVNNMNTIPPVWERRKAVEARMGTQ